MNYGVPKAKGRWGPLIAVGWLALLIGLWLFVRAQGASPVAFLGAALDTLRGEPLAPLWLLGVYLVRPLLLLPITLLTIAAGMLFGPVWGSVYAAVGALLSSSVAYLFGRLFGQDAVKGKSGWLPKLTQRPFDTVLLCRFLGVPGDLVNYAAGYLRISFAAFTLATLVGGLPGLLAGALAGASITSVTEARLGLQWEYLAASAVLLLLGLAVSWGVRRRSSTYPQSGIKNASFSDADR